MNPDDPLSSVLLPFFLGMLKSERPVSLIACTWTESPYAHTVKKMIEPVNWVCRAYKRLKIKWTERIIELWHTTASLISLGLPYGPNPKSEGIRMTASSRHVRRGLRGDVTSLRFNSSQIVNTTRNCNRYAISDDRLMASMPKVQLCQCCHKIRWDQRDWVGRDVRLCGWFEMYGGCTSLGKSNDGGDLIITLTP